MSTASDMLASYLAAELALLRGQKYRWGDRELSRADLAIVQAGRREWERKAAAELRGSGRAGVSLVNLSGMPMAPEGGEGEYPWRSL
jgi:hypothetical protein